MSKTLSVQKLHVVEFASSEYLNYGTDTLHYMLDALDVDYTTHDDAAAEYEDDFAIEKEGLERAITNLEEIKNGENVSYDRINVEDVESYFTDEMPLDAWIECFKWLINTADKNHEWIYVEFF